VLSVIALENVVVAAVTVVAIALMAISTIAYRRTRDSHLLFLTIAFSLFATKGLIFTATLFLSLIDLPGLVLLSGAFDLGILASFYGFTLRR